jgi:hypothetical protein
VRHRSAVGGGRRRVGDLSAVVGRVWRGRGGRGTSWGSERGGGGFEIFLEWVRDCVIGIFHWQVGPVMKLVRETK